MSVEESPEFQAALNEACEKQYRGYLYGGEFAKAHSKDAIADTMEEMQRQRREIEAKVKGIREHAEQVRRDARFMSGPHRDITANLKRRSGASGLICPVCGEGDHGNRMGKKPVCMMNAKHKGLGPILLVKPEDVKGWKPPKEKFKLREAWELDKDEIVKARGNKKRHK